MHDRPPETHERISRIQKASLGFFLAHHFLLFNPELSIGSCHETLRPSIVVGNELDLLRILRQRLSNTPSCNGLKSRHAVIHVLQNAVVDEQAHRAKLLLEREDGVQ